MFSFPLAVGLNAFNQFAKYLPGLFLPEVGLFWETLRLFFFRTTTWKYIII